MAEVTMKQLLEAGVHFGHQTSRWNPKMKPYIFGARNGIYIIDLQQTVKLFRDAYTFVRDVVADGGTLMFVGTKKQAQDAIREEAERCGMFYVNNRWLGGMLTNFQTIKQSIDRLKKLEEMLEDPKMAEALTKKEMLGIRRERDKLLTALGGIKNMSKLPDAMFVIDPKKEEIAVREANKLGHPRGRGGRHQLRSRSHRLEDPGQRRCDPRHPSVLRRRSPTRCSKARRSQRSAAAARTKKRARRLRSHRQPRARWRGKRTDGDPSRSGQGAPRENRRGLHGLQEGPCRGQRRPREGRALAPREGVGGRGQEGRPCDERGAGRDVHPRRRQRSACSSRSTARPTSSPRPPTSKTW